MDTITFTKDEERALLGALLDRRTILINKSNDENNGQLVEYDENNPLDREFDELRALINKIHKVYKDGK